MHDVEFAQTQQAKKALMCLPQSSVSITPKSQNTVYYAQAAQMKNMYSPYQAMLDSSIATSQLAASLETCPLVLQAQAAAAAAFPHMTTALSHSMESTILNTSAAAAAEQPTIEIRIDTSKHFHVFVGDLSKDVTNELLKSVFQKFGEVSEAKVIRDAQTQKSKGYGFVSFPVKQNAENAITGMNGKWIGKRAVRTNWASRKSTEENRDKLTFEQVFNSTKADNTSVYIGNICQKTTDTDLRDAFAQFGDIAEVRVFKTQRYAFVRYDKKECATKAIMEMNGREVGGSLIRCSWGRTQPVGAGQSSSLLPLDLSTFMLPTLLSSAATQIPFLQNPILNSQLYEPTAFLYNSIPQW